MTSAAERPQPGHGPQCTPNPDYDNERCIEHGNLVVASAARQPWCPVCRLKVATKGVYQPPSGGFYEVFR